MLHRMATILVSHDGHFEQKWPPKYKNPPDLGGIWFPTCFLKPQTTALKASMPTYTPPIFLW
jgi:hypothetical protein